MLRPTNLIIWATLSLFTLPCATQDEFIGLVRDASLWGSAVLMLSSCVDRLYYGDWVFPAANFLRYNLSQGLATFYGINRADYYLTEGLPILLTTILPFTFVGIVQRIGSHSAAPALKHLAITVLVYVAVLSCVSHKEARFLYPVIAPALALAAGPFSDFFAPLARQRSAWRGSLALLMVITTLTIAVYTSRVHNRGVISVMSYLRGQFHAANPDLVLGRIQQPTLESALFGTSRNQSALQPIDVGFLMPCHSTPWRSHLIYPEVEAWALTCEPPIGLSPREREQYKDEADIFYENPVSWMETHMGPILTESEPRAATAIAVSNKADSMKQWMDTKAWKGRRPWPRYVVFFAQLEPDIKTVLGREGSRYAECWRGFNSHWHDDWRRQGDVVVWCLDGSLDLDEALGDEAGMFD
ncbi:MAG: glycosylphosphatidylinositol anchor biosynthesis [Chrysothrix sp. TS-e1954]|nr:MAG: glycosylphosphatidylinositol anchor biosynthesis [Chrysothrix sp. TS-e1954]